MTMRRKMRTESDGSSGPKEGHLADCSAPSICIPLELFQEALDSLQYALRIHESLEYRLPTKQQQVELVENLVTIVEKLEQHRDEQEKRETCSSKVLQGKNVPTIVVEEAPKKIDEGLELTVRKLEEALRVQAEEMVQLKLQLGITTKLFEQLGVRNLVNLLKSEDIDICRTATKALANLAAQECFQEDIVQVGGLRSLFDLIERSGDEFTHRLAAGAIANLAVNETNQTKIVEEGGLPTLCELGKNSADPQTQKMVAGAIANLCGNSCLKETLMDTGSIRTFVSMAATRHPTVLEQVARGIANFVVKNDRADGFLKDGGLRCIVRMAKSSDGAVKKHVGLALYSLAQKESSAMQVLQAPEAVDFLVATKLRDGDSTQRMAEKTLGCLSRFNDSATKVLIQAAEARLRNESQQTAIESGRSTVP